MGLALVSDQNDNPSTVGSKVWADALRATAKNVAKEVERGYFDLAQLLASVNETRVNNDPNELPIYTLWGFATWGAWVEKDLNLSVHKANALVNIARRASVVLAGKPAKVRVDLEALGWTKVREVMRAATVDDVESWIEYAAKSSFSDIEATVKHHLDTVKSDSSDVSSKPIFSAQPKPATLTASAVSVPPTVSTVAYPSASAEVCDPPPIMAPAQPQHSHVAKVTSIVSMKRLMFVCHADQADMIEQAVARAKQTTGAESSAYNLALICTQFLGTIPFGKSDTARADFLASIAASMGIKIAAIDENGDVVINQIPQPAETPVILNDALSEPF